MFFYYQTKGGEEAWHQALAEHRSNVVDNKQPRYTTILDLDKGIDDSTTKDEIMAIKYKGPMYFDFDSDDIDDCIIRVQKFIKKLEDLEFDTSEASFYATGKKGFHVTIPQECFMSKPPAKGITGLPYIYKELAFSLYVDTMDIRVYSGRKGRMFRTVNVERENGKFKVQVTAQEIKDMDEEGYIRIIDKPRELIKATTPTLNVDLATMYSNATIKVEAAQKKRGSAQKDVEALAKFKGEFPATMQKVMNGDGIADGAGFNHIAMQIAITSNGLNKTPDDVIKLCEGLIAKHQSDGSRYNTPARREAEIRRMLDYTYDNVCYSYSVGAIKTLLKEGETAPDLDGVNVDEHGEVTSVSDEDSSESLYGGVFMTTKGVFRNTEDSVVQICDLVFKNIALLIDKSDNSVNGYEADIFFRGEMKGRKNLGLDLFTGKGRFVPWVLANLGVFTGNDNHVNALAGRMRDSAIKTGDVVYLVHKEGLDLIPRSTPEGVVTDIVWVGGDGVETQEGVDVKYRYGTKLTTNGLYKSDLLDSPGFSGCFDAEGNKTAQYEEYAKVIEALLNLNDPYVIANTLGWMTACFHRQLYHKAWNQFPICQIFGQAGSGKSTTVRSFLHLFYYLATPRITSANSNTHFTDQANMNSSASIPYVLDEYKPREFKTGRHAELRLMFREAFNQNVFGKGGGSAAAGANASWRDVQDYNWSAPILIIGEALEAETATLERSVGIQLSKTGLAGRSKNMDLVNNNKHVISALGKEIVDATFSIRVEDFKKTFMEISAEVKAAAFQGQNDRVVYNMTVVLQGLKFAQLVLSDTFEDRFDEKFKHLADTVKDTSRHVAMIVMPEAAKMLNVLSLMSRIEDVDGEFGLIPGFDYWQDDKFVDIKVRNCFVKGNAWSHRKHFETYYDSEEAFAQGLSGFVAIVDRAVPNSPLKDSPITKVFRFSKALLTAEKVEAFK
ncbi:hypothetical protein [Methylotenera sp.]|uniref:hypothetical protein n=1 Tax=Methylotenera sp. TaxID=2051956 RepID=UPI00248A793D|nr:hypothetical protein [Methylotenera sp.]MDI1360637.1 hypothetical protein [Methylotenera sp.]